MALAMLCAERNLAWDNRHPKNDAVHREWKPYDPEATMADVGP